MSGADWGQSTKLDFIALFCGDRLGEGVGREVYVLSTDPTKVIKVESSAGSFQNIIEYRTWIDLQGSKYEKFLAPCHDISPCGTVLIQSRVLPLRPEDEGVQLPTFLTDFKRSNYGVLNGQVVCCDYGTNLLLSHGAHSSKLRKPEWWGT